MLGQLGQVVVGAGRPIVLIHGGKLDHRHMLDAIEPVFAEVDGWRRVYVDLPGCGGSLGFDHVQSQDDVPAEIVEFVTKEGGGTPVAVVGESRGSYIAQGLAYTRPRLVSGLALIVPGGTFAEAKGTLPAPVTLIQDVGSHKDLESTVKGRAERLVVQSRSIIEKIRATKVPAEAVHDAALEARVQEHFAFSFHDAMLATGFDRPPVILSGRQDSIVGFTDAVGMFGAYPRATYALLDCAGHALSWERPDLFKALMRDWLERLETT